MLLFQPFALDSAVIIYYFSCMTLDEIKHALKDRGWTQKELAEKLKLHPGTVKNILSGQKPLTEQLAAHIELLLESTQEQLIVFKLTFPDVLCEKWLPGWEGLTPEQRREGLEKVMAEVAAQICEEEERKFTPEELAELKRFCSTLRGPTRFFEETAYGAALDPYA